MRRVVRTSVVVLLAVLLTVAAPAVAGARTDAGVAGKEAAVPASPQAVAAGWIGYCYPEVTDYTGGGWCDGNGPDWTYQGVVHCSHGRTIYGVVRWAGDRRKSWGYCYRGTGRAVWGGLYYYYKGQYWGSEIRGA